MGGGPSRHCMSFAWRWCQVQWFIRYVVASSGQWMTCLLCLGVWLINVGDCRITKCTIFPETDFTSLQLSLVPRGMLLFLDVPSGGSGPVASVYVASHASQKKKIHRVGGRMALFWPCPAQGRPESRPPPVHARPYPCPAKKTQGGLMKTQALLLPFSYGDPHHRSFHAAL